MRIMGTKIYTVITELKAEEMFKPTILAKQAAENNMAQSAKYMPLNCSNQLATITNDNIWKAEIANMMIIFEDK